MSLLVLSAGAVLYPLVLGVGMVFISLMFCDTGPISHCAGAGLMFLGAGVLLALCAFPAAVALASRRGRLGWYLKFYPFVLLGLACLACSLRFDPSMTRRVASLYGGMALLAFAHWFLSRRRETALTGDEAGAAGSKPRPPPL